MDPKWSRLLEKIINAPVAEQDADKVILDNEKEFANFAAYLLYRYKGAGRFAAEACFLLADLVSKGCGLADVARVITAVLNGKPTRVLRAVKALFTTRCLPTASIR